MRRGRPAFTIGLLAASRAARGRRGARRRPGRLGRRHADGRHAGSGHGRPGPGDGGRGRRRRRVQGRSVRGPAGGRSALASPGRGRPLGRRARRRRGGSHLRPGRRPGRRAERGLPVPERVGAGGDGRAPARALLDPRRRLHRRLGLDLDIRRLPSRGRRRRRGDHQLPPERLRVPRPPRPVGRVAAPRLGQLRAARHGGGPRVGARQHCGVRRRPRPRDHLRRVGRGRGGDVGHADAAVPRAVPWRHRPEQLDSRLGPAARGRRRGPDPGRGAGDGRRRRPRGRRPRPRGRRSRRCGRPRPRTCSRRSGRGRAARSCAPATSGRRTSTAGRFPTTRWPCTPRAGSIPCPSWWG